jgi:hypothetical protein|tara:strand:- start:45 stop:461 length:417 start_codon:yes stop_codon:yes gene_type:complete
MKKNVYKPLIDFYVDNAQSNLDLDRAMSILVRSQISPENVVETPNKSKSIHHDRNEKQRKHRVKLNNATRMVPELPKNGSWEKMKNVFGVTKASSITNWGAKRFDTLIDSGSIVQVEGTTQEDRYVNVSNSDIKSLMN